MNIPFDTLIAAIEQADGLIIDQIIDALRKRYRLLYPNQEVMFLSLPRDDQQERRRIIELILKMDA